MIRAVLAALLLTACGTDREAVASAFDLDAYCEHGCEATWTASCHYVTCGPDTYDIWEVPGWRCTWSCAEYDGKYQKVRIRWAVEGECFTKPTVETAECWGTL